MTIFSLKSIIRDKKSLYNCKQFKSNLYVPNKLAQK